MTLRTHRPDLPLRTRYRSIDGQSTWVTECGRWADRGRIRTTGYTCLRCLATHRRRIKDNLAKGGDRNANPYYL